MPEVMPQAEAAILETISETGLFQRRLNQLIETEERVSKKLEQYNHIANVVEAEEKAKQKIVDAENFSNEKIAEIQKAETNLRAQHEKLAAENQAASEAVSKSQAEVVEKMEELQARRAIAEKTQADLDSEIAALTAKGAELDAAIKEHVAEMKRYTELRANIMDFLSGLEG